ncbi:MAG TPA: hypothetical protein VN670_06140 [Acidobacteriaceae bacterium]|nr:hypothetical protein [Acidobacteriaceae bacterium]
MTMFDRRTFVQLSTGALLTAASRNFLGQSGTPRIVGQDGVVKVQSPNYSWEYLQADDTFSLRDSENRLMAMGTVQPAVIVAPIENPSLRHCTLGKMTGHHAEPGRIRFDYEDVNGTSGLSVTWRFDEHGLWTEPVVYQASTAQDVVSLHYFANPSGTTITPSLRCSVVVVPGICQSPAVSPIIGTRVRLDQNVWLGHGDSGLELSQQWGLPVHFFCGFGTDDSGQGARDKFTSGMSDAFTCGLADLPNGDLFFKFHHGNTSLWIDYRSDLWKHLRGPGKLTLGSTLFWAIGANYYDAIGQYYQGLLQAGIIRRKINSPRKTAAALAPQFCTWGAQADRNKIENRLDEAFLYEIYRELKASGMKANMFSIDDKWEGRYGRLEHSKERLPHFEQFLNQVRTDGHRIGLWAALMRCEDPSDLGLTEDNMLQGTDGKPFKRGGYYILDFTQPEVAKVSDRLAREFIRRYKPDLVKFDFGYELPSVANGAPQDKSWAGERMLWKGLNVVIRAMKEENPDLVVMYYQLSPLFLDFFDLNGIDDMWLAAGEYDVEANRRMFFSSLLGPLGVPTYGSSGYDWASAPHIWFDSSAVGTLGSLNDFRADEQGEGSTPERIAKYNGLTHALRSSNMFKIVPLDVVYEGPTLGAHARSWARMEEGELVLLAYRPGEKNPLASRVTVAGVEKAVQSDVPVVVASKDKHGIAQTSNLAVVPYGNGEIVIRRLRGGRADALSHYFDGTVVQHQSKIENGQLKLTAKERNSADVPLEWIEIRIS